MGCSYVSVSWLCLGFSEFTVFRWIQFFILHMPLFTVDMRSFLFGTAMDLERTFKQKIAYLPQKVAYYLWKTAYLPKECKSSETNYDILNSNSDLNSDGGTPQLTVRDEFL